MSLTKTTVPMTRKAYLSLRLSPKAKARNQMRNYCHVTEIYLAGELVAVRTITASNTVYMGVKP